MYSWVLGALEFEHKKAEGQATGRSVVEAEVQMWER